MQYMMPHSIFDEHDGCIQKKYLENVENLASDYRLQTIYTN